jgi:hypothetical protein
MFNRRIPAVLPAVTALFFLAACGGDDTADDVWMDTDAPPAATADPAMDHSGMGEMTAQFVEVDGSGASGTVRVSADGAGTRIVAMVMGAGAGVHQGHIHSGTCAQRGGAVVPLEPITTDASGTGEATSTVDVPLETVANGQHIVVYHEAGGSPGASVVCADIPAHTM